MNIGIIGAGEMGGKLGKLWTRAGHKILFSSRHPEQLKDLAKEAGNSARTGTVEEAVKFGEVILFSVSFSSMEDAVGRAQGLKSKIVIDITNPVSWDEQNEQLVQLLPRGVTAVSKLKQAAPDARIVKAYSHLPSQHLVKDSSRAKEDRITVFYCGDDGVAKRVVATLIEDSGFTPLDLGGLDQAGLMEIPGPLAFKAVKLNEAKHLVDQAHQYQKKSAA
jgi:predicted dinucleotide-binding enzyme